ncbi:MAG: RNA-directed DNA polymerase [Planctomycetes bacterium]|nr:RNA-directed DNA polymerase [Planctomycetota bacterium]
MFSWLGGGEPSSPSQPTTDRGQQPDPQHSPTPPADHGPDRTSRSTTPPRQRPRIRRFPPKRNPRLNVRSHDQQHRRNRKKASFLEVTGASPYRFARFGSQTGRYLDFSRDGDDARLRDRGLPVFHTPEELAEWLGLTLNKLAWLVHRFSNGRPDSVDHAHYHFTWRKKRSGGVRLIESPKQTLKEAQVKILREILDRVPTHPAAHGFVAGRSVLTNAKSHVGQGIVVKFDLTNFYTTVSYSRVVAIFRTLGYAREAAIWLGLLTTNAVPGNMPFDRQKLYSILPYWRRHLPQGAPTSPALANLSAYHLDARLTGMARAFGADYTRYADDLTISGPETLSYALRTLIPLVEQIIRRERFQSNRSKRQVLRAHQRQVIAGVVVNVKPNVSRANLDRLKATLTNCVRMGPSTQNRDQVEDFQAHLRGRIAHVLQLNPARGEQLLAIFHRIDWRR